MHDTISYKNLKAGEVIAQDHGGKVSLHAYVHGRGLRSIGTISGATYETVKPALLQPETSFCLSQSELAALEEFGAQFIRIIPPSKAGTYAISLADFKVRMQSYFSRGYGSQWRVPLKAFQYIDRVAPRNAIIDSPALERPGLSLPHDRQPRLFG